MSVKYDKISSIDNEIATEQNFFYQSLRLNVLGFGLILLQNYRWLIAKPVKIASDD